MNFLFCITLSTRFVLFFIIESKILSKLIPNEYAKISESGISNSSEILLLKDYGFDGFLIGEKFMSKSNPGNELSKMMKDLYK